MVKKSVLPFFIITKRIRRRVGIDDKTHQLCDAYFFGLPVLDTKRIFCPPLWKLFNSYDFEELPEKEWTEWSAQDEVLDGEDNDSDISSGRRSPLAAVSSFFSHLFFLPDEEEEGEPFPEEDEELPDHQPFDVWPSSPDLDDLLEKGGEDDESAPFQE